MLPPQRGCPANRGMLNREVAAELVVSAKTVGYHLGNVYSKLGVSSRSQLAARFATFPR